MKLQRRNGASGNNQKRKLKDTKKKFPSLHLFSFICLFLCIPYFLFPNEKRRRKIRREEKNERRKGRRKEGRKKGGVREEGKEKEL